LPVNSALAYVGTLRKQGFDIKTATAEVYNSQARKRRSLLAINLWNFTTMPKSQRNLTIDMYRGIAVILVTSFHLFLWSNANGVSSTFGFDLIGFAGNGWVGVGIFFVLSGYCMSMSTSRMLAKNFPVGTIKIYFIKRFLRISPPYYFSMVFWFLLINYLGVTNKSTNAQDIITHITYTHNLSQDTFFSISGVYWSLAVEMQFYFLLPFFFYLFKNRKLTTTLLIISFLSCVLTNLIASSVVVRWSLFNYLYLFILGWFVFQNKKVISNALNRFRQLIFFAFVLVIFYKGNGYDNTFKVYEIITSTLFSLVLALSSTTRSYTTLPVQFLSFIGRCSFSIYLYNYIFWIFDREKYTLFGTLFIFTFVIAFGMLMYWLVERKTEMLRVWLISKVWSGEKGA